MDQLQEKIRKLKCPIVLDLAVEPACVPQGLSYPQFCRELLEGLKGNLPAVRFSFDQFAMQDLGGELKELMALARELGYFVLLDGPAVLSPWAAQRAAEGFFGPESLYPCDGMILSPYIGEDAIKPFLPYCKEQGKSVFFAVRSANKTAAQLQDLMTGSRLSHIACADIVNRHAEGIIGRSGYSQVGALTAGTNANAVKNLRAKYNRLFLLVDGYDYPGGNGKNCSFGFDRFGHGCAVSVGPAIAGAWREEEGGELVPMALQALQRVKNNLKTYVTIL